MACCWRPALSGRPFVSCGSSPPCCRRPSELLTVPSVNSVGSCRRVWNDRRVIRGGRRLDDATERSGSCASEVVFDADRWTPGHTLHVADRRVILNHMVQYLESRLDASFAALSDATRRGVLEQLGRADASITDLAARFDMTLTGMKKHVGVLEQTGLVITEKVGRVRTCKLGLRRLEEEMAWIERYRQLWDARFDELDKVVEELKRKEKVDGRKKSK